MNELWPHQALGLARTRRAIEAGDRTICFTSPTGGGKSLCMTELIRWARDRDQKVILLTNRRQLLDQTMRVLAAAHIRYGIRAADFKPDDSWPVQLSMIQTELSRVYRNKTWARFPADLVLIDEAHQQGSGGAVTLIDDYKAAGAAVVGFTATPVSLAHVYRQLIVAGVNSELRECGAHVPAFTFGPDEPDAKNLEFNVKTGEVTDESNRRAFRNKAIFGRVLHWWKKLNPEQKPAILFAPGVGESIWFAEQFREAGVSVAHIDGESISYGEVDAEGNSVVIPSSRENREKIRQQSQSGEIKIITNRFVMREGVDFPWLYHGIFATVFGALSSYLQAGGRLLRNHESLGPEGERHVVIQDHGGNWWRHGSLNSDREWDLTWSNAMHAGVRAQELREHSEREPIVCPKCAKIRPEGKTCPACGYMNAGKSRVVIQSDGTLREMTGDIFQKRETKKFGNTEALFREMYFRGCSKKWNATFAQVVANFYHEHHYWPPRDIPLMPREPIDYYRKVRDVPKERLH